MLKKKEYMKGINKVCADMLLRLMADKLAKEPIEMAGVNKSSMVKEIPFDYYKIDKDQVRHCTNPEP